MPSGSSEAGPTSPSRHVVQLAYRDDDGDVTVTPQDESRFTVRLNRAIEILRLHGNVEPQLKVLVNDLARWLRGRAEAIDSAYLTVRDGDLSFVVVRNQMRFNEEFEDALSDLELRLADDADLDLIRVHTLSLPLAADDAVGAFLHPDFALRFPHGQRAQSYRVSEQGS